MWRKLVVTLEESGPVLADAVDERHTRRFDLVQQAVAVHRHPAVRAGHHFDAFAVRHFQLVACALEVENEHQCVDVSFPTDDRFRCTHITNDRTDVSAVIIYRGISMAIIVYWTYIAGCSHKSGTRLGPTPSQVRLAIKESATSPDGFAGILCSSLNRVGLIFFVQSTIFSKLT